MPILCVIPGPNRFIKSEPAVLRWCFGCRKHLDHEWQLWGDSEPSYYEPSWMCICSGCGRDRTEFGS